MMSVEESLGGWSTEMGFRQKDDTLGLSEEQLKELTLVHMRSVWRHIVRHVRPRQEVEMMRKNLLLHRLKQGKKLDKKINMKLASVDQLKNYHEMNKVKEELVKLEEEENYLQKSIKAKVLENKLKKNELESKKQKLEESVSTLEIWKLKGKSIDDKMKELVEVEGILNELKPQLKESSFDEYNENKSKVSQCIPKVINYVKLRRTEDITDEEKKREYKNLLDFIRGNTFSIRSSTSLTTLLESIASCSDRTKKLAWKDVKDPSMTQMFIDIGNELFVLFQTHILLNTSVADKNKVLATKSKELEESKRKLIMDIRKFLNLSDTDDEKTVTEYFENSLKLILLKEESLALNESINKVVGETKSKITNEFEMDRFHSKLARLNNDFYKKGVVLVKCKSSLASNDKKLKNTRLEICESIAETLTVHFSNICDNPAKVLQESLKKEFELFLQVPLAAMTRNWESDLQLDCKTIQKVLNTPLSDILLRSDQNYLTYVLHLICWSKLLKHRNSKQIEDGKENVLYADDFNNSLKEMNVEKAEKETEKFMSVVRFYKNQPTENYIPEELKVDDVGYSTWKKMQTQ